MAGSPYLFRPRGKGYVFQMAVPKVLRGQFLSSKGKPLTKITTGLNTGNPLEARKRAAILRAEWILKFDAAAKAADVPAWNQRPIIRGDGRLTFAEAAELHLASLSRDKDAAPRQQTIQTHRAIHALFTRFIENAALNAVTRGMANDFLTNVGQKRRLSNRSLNKYAVTLAGVFRWARDAGKLEIGNPFERKGFKEAQGTGWLPFSDEELTALLPVDEPTDALGWAMLIGAYSGLRLNEIAGLHTTDLQSQNGITFFDIRENAERRLKTPSSARRIPVHSRLLDAGLSIYALMRPEGPLFDLTPGGPDRKPGKYLGEKFMRYRREHRVIRKRLSFHSFRKNFATALERASISITDAALLLGHSRAISFGVYSSGPGLERLRDAVEKVKYATPS
jgi:integrase